MGVFHRRSRPPVPGRSPVPTLSPAAFLQHERLLTGLLIFVPNSVAGPGGVESIEKELRKEHGGDHVLRPILPGGMFFCSICEQPPRPPNYGGSCGLERGFFAASLVRPSVSPAKQCGVAKRKEGHHSRSDGSEYCNFCVPDKISKLSD